MLPALLGEKYEKPLRPYTLHQTLSVAMGIREGDWKLLDHTGSGGNNYERNPDLRQYILPNTAPEAEGQLYNLAEDPGETANLWLKQPSRVEKLKSLPDATKERGQSR